MYRYQTVPVSEQFIFGFFAKPGVVWYPAGAKGIEPLLVVLETTVLPLNDAPMG